MCNTCGCKEAETFEADSKPYYEVMVDSSRLDNLNADFDGLTMELQNPLDGYVFSLDYGEGGDEPPMTPSEASSNYMNQVGITTYSYEPDWDEEKDDYTYGKDRPEWQGTINFPEGKSGEGGKFYARVFGFKDGESETEAEEKIMSHVIDNVHVYVRERDEEDRMYYPVDGYYAETRNRYGNRYITRDSKGKFKKNVSVGRSLSADRRRKAKRVPSKSGQGDKGDYNGEDMTLKDSAKLGFGLGAGLLGFNLTLLGVATVGGFLLNRD